MRGALRIAGRRFLAGGLAVGGVAFAAQQLDTPAHAAGFFAGSGLKQAPGHTGGGAVSRASHLSSTGKRFRNYADSLCELNGKPLISARAFLASVLGSETVESVRPEAATELQRLFDKYEPKNGGRLGSDAYNLLTLMMTTSGTDMRQLFLLYDSNESGTLTARQLAGMIDTIGAARDSSAKVTLEDNGVADLLFGKNRSKEVALADFERFSAELRRTVWRAGFNQWDDNKSNTVTPEQYLRMALSSAGVVGQHQESRVQKALRSGLPLQKEYAYESWVALQLVAQNHKEIERMMSMARKKFPLDPKSWYLLCRSANVSISKRDTDLLFTLIANREGAVDIHDVQHGLALFGQIAA